MLGVFAAASLRALPAMNRISGNLATTEPVGSDWTSSRPRRRARGGGAHDERPGPASSDFGRHRAARPEFNIPTPRARARGSRSTSPRTARRPSSDRAAPERAHSSTSSSGSSSPPRGPSKSAADRSPTTFRLVFGARCGAAGCVPAQRHAHYQYRVRGRPRRRRPGRVREVIKMAQLDDVWRNCPRDSTPSSASAGFGSPVVSVSASGLPARSTGDPGCWCWTRRPRRSTTSPSTRSPDARSTAGHADDRDCGPPPLDRAARRPADLPEERADRAEGTFESSFEERRLRAPGGARRARLRVAGRQWKPSITVHRGSSWYASVPWAMRAWNCGMTTSAAG